MLPDHRQRALGSGAGQHNERPGGDSGGLTEAGAMREGARDARHLLRTNYSVTVDGGRLKIIC